MPVQSPSDSPLKVPGSPKWVPDKEAVKCGGCDEGFSFTRRRHHCRSCGRVFCSGCTKGVMSVEGYKGLVRVCNKCMLGVAWEEEEEAPCEIESESDGSTTPPITPRDERHPTFISTLLKASLKIANSYPSERFGTCCRPHVQECKISILFNSDKALLETLGVLKDVSKIADDAPQSLHSIRKQFAEAACGITQQSPLVISSSVWGVAHKVTQINVSDTAECGEGSFVGTKVLNVVGRGEEKAGLLSTCVAEVGGVIIGRHGRVDTSVKARQLAKMVEYVLRRRGLLGVGVRLRFCSLLNALSVTPKEMLYFKNQLTLLAGFPDSSTSTPTPTAPIPIQSSPVHGPHSFTPTEPLTLTPPPPLSTPLSVDESYASSIPPIDLGTSTFDFQTAMADLNVDYSYLNFVANWPLSLRLGNQPQSKHNMLHDIGLKKHLQWLIMDVQDALLSVDLKMEISPVSHEDPWRGTLVKVKKAVDALCRASTTPKEKAHACNLFMACNLLSELTTNKGSNFRRRAAELLQLCLLEHILGIIPFFNCKSGIDRTGVCNALWASVSQMLTSDKAPPLWLFYYLAMNYSLAVKICKGVHNCVNQVPVCQLEESNFTNMGILLPHPAGGSVDAAELEMYSHVEELFQLVASKNTLGSAIETLAYQNIKALFMADADALLPSLQYAFFVNIMSSATRIACISTGVHGLKYGDCGKIPGHHNALAAQYLPSTVSSPNHVIKVTGLRRNLAGTDIIITKEFAPYLVAAADARGT